MLRGNSEESSCQLQRFFSTIRGFYVSILNQWYLISNNHEKSRIQVRISTVIRFRVINLNFSCHLSRFCLILQMYHRLSSVWSSIFTSKVITFGLTSLHPWVSVGMTDTQKKISRTLIELHQNVYLRNSIKSVHCALCASKIEKSKLTECILDKKTAQRQQ